MPSTGIRRFAFGGDTTAPTWTISWRSAVFAGRVFLSLIFIVSGIAKLYNWIATIESMEAQGIPWAPVLLFLAVLVEVLGGLSILTGTFARFGAALLALYLIPVTALYHDFWNLQGAARDMQMSNFLKNASIFGGMLLILGFGAGKLSVDSKLKKTSE